MTNRISNYNENTEKNRKKTKLPQVDKQIILIDSNADGI